MSLLAPIINSAESIAALFQPSLDAAFIELEATFGFWPRVLAPNGGARTAAQCDALGTSHLISDHWEDALNRAAVDIDNHREFRDINEALFLSILAKHGWHNMTVSGAPFPTEPWHFAKHGITTADNGSVPLDNTIQGEEEVATNSIVTFLKQTTLDSNGNRVKGKTLAATADLSLRHPANFVPFVCNYVDSGPGDVLVALKANLGLADKPSVILNDAEWAAWSAALNTP